MVLLGLNVVALHSGMQQRARLKSLDRFVSLPHSSLISVADFSRTASRLQRTPSSSLRTSLLVDLTSPPSLTSCTTRFLARRTSTCIALDVLLVQDKKDLRCSSVRPRRSRCSDCSWPVSAKVRSLLFVRSEERELMKMSRWERPPGAAFGFLHPGQPQGAY